jgi:hypothetical protein
MDHASERLLEALASLEAVAETITADEAPSALDVSAVQQFWKDWPRVGAWGGAVWRRINEDLAEPSSGTDDGELDEIGGEGG